MDFVALERKQAAACLAAPGRGPAGRSNHLAKLSWLAGWLADWLAGERRKREQRVGGAEREAGISNRFRAPPRSELFRRRRRRRRHHHHQPAAPCKQLMILAPSEARMLPAKRRAATRFCARFANQI